MPSFPTVGGRGRFLLVLSLLGSAAGAHAQYPAGATVQSLPSADDPGERLATALRTLSVNPGDRRALIAAGRNSLLLGDPNAAAGFFGRADQIDPRSGEAKAGLGATFVQLERPADALRLFAQASAFGVADAEIASDRGLAHDLAGDPQAAQRDYRAALAAHPGDDVSRRRLALSQGIAGDRAGALATLDPLIRRSDRAAWRAQTFVLAMTGDAAGANAITRVMLPQQQASLQPFLVRLAALPAADKARAVHFGEMPSGAPVYAARTAPTPVPPRPSDLSPIPAAVATASPARALPPTVAAPRRAVAPAAVQATPAPVTTAPADAPSVAVAVRPSGVVTAGSAPRAPIATASASVAPAGTPPATATPATASGARVADARPARGYVPFIGSRYEYQPLAQVASSRRPAAPGTPQPAPVTVASSVPSLPPAVTTAATAPAAAPATLVPESAPQVVAAPSPGAAVPPVAAATVGATQPEGGTPPMPTGAIGLPVGASASAGHYDLPHATVARRPTRTPPRVAQSVTAQPTKPPVSDAEAAPEPPVGETRTRAGGSGALSRSRELASAPPDGASASASRRHSGAGPRPEAGLVRRAAGRAHDADSGAASSAPSDDAGDRADRSATRTVDDGRAGTSRKGRARTGRSQDRAAAEEETGTVTRAGHAERDGTEDRTTVSRRSRSAGRDSDGAGPDRNIKGKATVVARTDDDGQSGRSKERTVVSRSGRQTGRDPDETGRAANRKEKAGSPRVYVQVAGGANRDDLGKAWAGVRKQAPELMRGRSPSTTPLKATNRLLVGPFKDEDDAQGFVNKMAGKGVSGFVVRTAKGQKVEPIDDGR